MLLLLLACGGADPQIRRPPGLSESAPTPYTTPTGVAGDTGTTPTETGPCGLDQLLVGPVCMDRYEAPNRAGALPLVMYTFVEAQAWCEARSKRLCDDDHWLTACEGPQALTYPYGDAHQPGLCRDDATWRVYNQSLLSAWPAAASSPAIESLDELLDAARDLGASASADHVDGLYQALGSGEAAACAGEAGVADLVGNVEEWTRRADGGAADFHGNLKGRYWAESRTCQGNILVHGDGFRFYEIGFRCCSDPS